MATALDRENLWVANPAAMAEHKSAKQIVPKTVRLFLRVCLVVVSILSPVPPDVLFTG